MPYADSDYERSWKMQTKGVTLYPATPERLYAAAPEMLRTCRSLLTMLEDAYEDDLYRHGSPSEDAWPAMLASARAVIAKAEGRSE